MIDFTKPIRVKDKRYPARFVGTIMRADAFTNIVICRDVDHDIDREHLHYVDNDGVSLVGIRFENGPGKIVSYTPFTFEQGPFFFGLTYPTLDDAHAVAINNSRVEDRRWTIIKSEHDPETGKTTFEEIEP